MKVFCLTTTAVAWFKHCFRALFHPAAHFPYLPTFWSQTDEGRLRLSATNLELGISCWIGAQIEEEGSITVPARTFGDLVSALPNEVVYLDLNERNHTLMVRCGASNTDIKGIDAQEFPPMPVPDLDAGIELNVFGLQRNDSTGGFCRIY